MLMSDFERVLPEISPQRDMYVYADNQEGVAEAANKLREAGFERVSQLQGGLAGWKAVAGSTEGRAA
jgi:rhodanese-related sulfurtransferase